MELDDYISKAAMQFQKKVDEELQKVFDFFIAQGYKKEDFVLGCFTMQPNRYQFIFKGEVVYEIEFKHQFTVDGKPLESFI